MEHVLLLESLLLKAANGNDCSTELNEIDKSLYKDDLDIDRLRRQILLLVDVIRVWCTIRKRGHISAYDL